MKVIASLITSFTAVLAATQDSNPAVGRTNIVEAHSLSNCSKDTWLPVIAGDSWFTPETDAANQDHYEVTHPALPDGIILPDPLLPTDNATIKAVYALAIEHHDHAAKKTEKEHRGECEKRMQDIDKFDIMCRCAHAWFFQSPCRGTTRWSRTFFAKGYQRKYKELKDKLKIDMKIEGYIELGQRLKNYMDENGEKL